jgi:hypothetical protein
MTRPKTQPELGSDDRMDMTVHTGSEAEYLELIALLAQERHLLEQLRFGHTQLRLVIEADQSRFIGQALDEIDTIEYELQKVGAQRARLSRRIAKGAGVGGDVDLGEIISAAPPGLIVALESVRGDIEGLLARTNEERRRARAASHEKVPARRTHRSH